MTLNLVQRSFRVIDFGTNGKRMCIFLLVVNSNLDSYLAVAPFQRYDGLNVENRHFPYPTPIPAKIWGCSLWSRSVVLGPSESDQVRLISREIIFQEFEPY